MSPRLAVVAHPNQSLSLTTRCEVCDTLLIKSLEGDEGTMRWYLGYENIGID